MSENIHSTGRGGTGNIGPDDSVYTDGEIVREGPEGKSAAGSDFSTGRGGQGNIADEGPAVRQARVDEDVVPEPAMREGEYSEYHTGRGGGGNVHKEKYGGHSSAEEQARAEKEKETGHKEGLVGKMKQKLGMDKEKEKSGGS
ncbi:MAG: hypothetical protein M1828_004252 [Chrysothrix sp. TS-e1954]|nr:MAG: hypothetical protein M1828_004252 [Chrysothrix sp. TS-e1954]